VVVPPVRDVTSGSCVPCVICVLCVMNYWIHVYAYTCHMQDTMGMINIDIHIIVVSMANVVEFNELCSCV